VEEKGWIATNLFVIRRLAEAAQVCTPHSLHVEGKCLPDHTNSVSLPYSLRVCAVRVWPPPSLWFFWSDLSQMLTVWRRGTLSSVQASHYLWLSPFHSPSQCRNAHTANYYHPFLGVRGLELTVCHAVFVSSETAVSFLSHCGMMRFWDLEKSDLHLLFSLLIKTTSMVLSLWPEGGFTTLNLSGPGWETKVSPWECLQRTSQPVPHSLSLTPPRKVTWCEEVQTRSRAYRRPSSPTTQMSPQVRVGDVTHLSRDPI
jgi:hypothetical protein